MSGPTIDIKAPSISSPEPESPTEKEDDQAALDRKIERQTGLNGTVPVLPSLTLGGLTGQSGADGADGLVGGVPGDGGVEAVIKPDIPWRYRLLAFSMIIFFATSSSFCENTLGPLKSTLIKELKITSE